MGFGMVHWRLNSFFFSLILVLCPLLSSPASADADLVPDSLRGQPFAIQLLKTTQHALSGSSIFTRQYVFAVSPFLVCRSIPRTTNLAVVTAFRRHRTACCAGIHHAPASYNCGLLLGSNAAVLKRPKGVRLMAWLLEDFGCGVQPGRAPGFFFSLRSALARRVN